MIKTSVLATLALTFAATIVPMTASAYPSTLTMTCKKAASLVASRGEIVLGTGPHIYDRYVAHGGFCGRDEAVRPAYVQTRDAAACFVGYTCRQSNRGSGGGGAEF